MYIWRSEKDHTDIAHCSEYERWIIIFSHIAKVHKDRAALFLVNPNYFAIITLSTDDSGDERINS
jgi:hypothetical protein